MNNWIKHDGGICPVTPETKVRVVLGDEEPPSEAINAGEMYWEWVARSPRFGEVHHYQVVLEDSSTSGSAPVKSDGGSSGYYKITIKNEKGEEFHCETNDVLYAFVGGDFDLANIVKACRRMYEASQGRGKAGTDISYDARKVEYFVKDFEKRFGTVVR